MGVRRMGPAMLALVSLAACGGSGGSEPFVAPTNPVECARAAHDLRGGSSSDTTSRYSKAHSTETRALGETGTIYLCGPEDEGAHVSFVAMSSVEVEPDRPCR